MLMERSFKDRSCEWCGNTYTPGGSRAKYCSPVCRGKARYWYIEGGAEKQEMLQSLVCHECGNIFSAGKMFARFCSASCQQAAYRRNKPEKSILLTRQWQEENPERVEDYKEKARRKYRVDRGEFLAALACYHPNRAIDKDGYILCYLCEINRPTDVDHDHSCSPARKHRCDICIRGLACGPCNRLIGLADDDPERLHRIADNLQTAKEAVRIRQISAGVAKGAA